MTSTDDSRIIEPHVVASSLSSMITLPSTPLLDPFSMPKERFNVISILLRKHVANMFMILLIESSGQPVPEYLILRPATKKEVAMVDPNYIDAYGIYARSVHIPCPFVILFAGKHLYVGRYPGAFPSNEINAATWFDTCGTADNECMLCGLKGLGTFCCAFHRHAYAKLDARMIEIIRRKGWKSLKEGIMQ